MIGKLVFIGVIVALNLFIAIFMVAGYWRKRKLKSKPMGVKEANDVISIEMSMGIFATFYFFELILLLPILAMLLHR